MRGQASLPRHQLTRAGLRPDARRALAPLPHHFGRTLRHHPTSLLQDCRYSGPAYKFIITDESAPSNFPLQPFRLLCPLCSGLPAKSQLVRTTMPKAAKKTTEKKVKAKKGPSAYNLFMKSELAKIKKADPKLDHKEAFKKAAANWSKSKK